LDDPARPGTGITPTVTMIAVSQPLSSRSIRGTRHIVPRIDFVWTHFGFEDDTPD
jgi:hypothetical protein